MTIAAVSASLISVLTGEQLNRRLQEEGLVLQTVVTRHHLQRGAIDLSDLAEGTWSVRSETATTGEGTATVPWNLVSIWGGLPPSAGPRIAFRAQPAYWE